MPLLPLLPLLLLLLQGDLQHRSKQSSRGHTNSCSTNTNASKSKSPGHLVLS
jgi:hypothetical protein